MFFVVALTLYARLFAVMASLAALELRWCARYAGRRALCVCQENEGTAGRLKREHGLLDQAEGEVSSRRLQVGCAREARTRNAKKRPRDSLGNE